MDWLDEFFNGGDNEAQERMVTRNQIEVMRGLIDSSKVKNCAKEIKIENLPNDSIYLGKEFAPYGDWDYYLTPEGTIVCTYFGIGE